MRPARAPLYLTLLGLSHALGPGCASDTTEGAASPVPLRCEGVPAPDRDRIVVSGLWSTSMQVGPCGQVAIHDRDDRTWLASPQGDVDLLAERVRELSFSPSGDGLLYRTDDHVVAARLDGGGETTMGAPEATWGWLPLEGALVPVACTGDEVRVATGPDATEVRVVADDAFSCVAFAEAAPVMVYRDLEGTLVRLDVSTGERRALPEVPFRSEGFADADLARGDLAALSRDGWVLLYEERWRRPWGFETVGWAAAYDLRDGSEIGTFLAPKSREGVEPLAVPGSGHALVVGAGDWMVVVTEGFELAGYEGWQVWPTPAGDHVVALRQEDASVHAIDVTGEGAVSATVLAEDLGDQASRLAVSARGIVAAPRREECIFDSSLGYCRTVESVWRWRFRRAVELPARFLGSVTVHWVSDGGAVLLGGTLAEEDEEIEGVFLYAGDGRRLVSWPGLYLRELRATEDHLLVLLGDRSGGSYLQILDSATGLARTVASGDGGLALWVDEREESMLYVVGRRVDLGIRGWTVEWDLHVAPLAVW